MKRYLKYCGIAVCILTLVFSLTSCFTTPPSSEDYIQWEFNSDISTLTNGEQTYDFHSKFSGYWHQSGNSCFYYLGDAYTENGMVADISRPIDGNDILCVNFYESNYREHKYTAFYATADGAKKLDNLEPKSIFGSTYLVDYDEGESIKLDEEFKNTVWSLANETRNTVSVATHVLNDADKLEVVSYELGGFLKHVHGVFYFNRANVYFLDLDNDNQNIYDDSGFLLNYDSYDVVELNEEDRGKLGALTNEMDHFVYNVEYEEPKYNEGYDPEADLAVAKIILAVITAFFGIVLPIIPIVFALRTAIKRKWHIEIIDCILLGASAVWLISGIVVFILILI